MSIKLRTASFRFTHNGKHVNVNWEEPDTNEYKFKVNVYYENKLNSFKADCNPNSTNSIRILRQLNIK